MRTRTCLWALCLAISPLASAETPERPEAEQEALARDLFRKIRAKDTWDLQDLEALYLRVIGEAPLTGRAEDAYWYLGNMYIQAFSPPRLSDATALFEQYRARYPNSRRLETRFPMFARPGETLVQGRLRHLYEEAENWEAAAALYRELIPDPTTADPVQADRLLPYARVLERVGRNEDAIAAYRAFLEKKERPGEFQVRAARLGLERLGEEPPPQAATTHPTLHRAAAAGDIEEVKRHLEGGTDPSEGQPTGRGWTPLHHAAAAGHLSVVEHLLGAGADPRRTAHFVPFRDTRDQPLHVAARAGHDGVLRVLLAAGADMNAGGSGGRTALHEAAGAGHTEAVTLLLEQGADRKAADDHARTPRDLAEAEGHAGIIQLLADPEERP